MILETRHFSLFVCLWQFKSDFDQDRRTSLALEIFTSLWSKTAGEVGTQDDFKLGVTAGLNNEELAGGT